MDEPGQDVENFGNKMSKMDRRIIRTGSDPIDLSTFLDTNFIDCKLTASHVKAAGLYDLIDSNPKALSVYDTICNLKNKSRFLKAQIMCSPSERKKSYMEVELVGINLAINNMVESQKRGGNGRSKHVKARDLRGITSF